jgi:hypothetical protein
MKELLNERGAAKRNCDGEPITQGVIYATRRVFEELERRPLAATNADEIKQLQRGQTLNSTPRRRQKGLDNYENRRLRERETDNSLRLGRVIQYQDAVNIVSRIRGDQNVGNREDSNHNQCNSRTSNHGETCSNHFCPRQGE